MQNWFKVLVVLCCVSCSQRPLVRGPEVDRNSISWDKLKLGVVLSPGGARTQAQIGFLRELEKNQIPVHAVVGVEWGAYVGALFSQKGKSNDVEWQVSKIDSEIFSKKLLSSGTKRTEDIGDFLNTSFGKLRLEDSKIPFSCPTMNLQDQQTRWLNSGYAVESLKLCLPLYPLLYSSAGQIAGVLDLQGAQKYLKSQGANYFIFVDVVSYQKPTFQKELSEESRWVWSFTLKEISNTKNIFHDSIEIPVKSDLSDFKSKKKLIEQGELAGKEFVFKLKKCMSSNHCAHEG